MKKLSFSLLALLVAAVVCVGFTSCGGDDEDSYNVTDENAVTLLQGTWDVKVTETDDEGSETDEYVWEVEGNRIKMWGSWGNFSVSNGKLLLSAYNEEYTFTKLTSTSFHCYGEDRYGYRVDISGTKRKD